ncbi:MAG: hypothetical protein QXU48_00340 [Thermoplasmata archaeon]
MFDYTYLGIENASFETIVNAYVGDAVITTGWADRLVVWAQSPKVNILAIDYYPGTWVWASFDQWAPLTHLFNIANSYGKKCAIMETGFSTYDLESLSSLWHTQDDQEIFINTALPIVREKSFGQNVYHPQNKMLFSSWYELRDGNTNLWLGPLPQGIEAHFGIFCDALCFKRGYDDLQRQIFSFYS